MNKESFVKALEELRKFAVPRNFIQTVDLIINLADIDVRKTPVSAPVILPHQVRETKVCAFLNEKSSFASVDKTVTKNEIMADWPKTEIKRLAKSYDIFISSAALMPTIAAKFGRILGAAGKMPNPKTGGVLMKGDDNELRTTVERLKKTTNVKAKEPSMKMMIGKETDKNEDLAENAIMIYDAILNVLPNRRENIRSVMLKFTMSKPIKLKEK